MPPTGAAGRRRRVALLGVVATLAVVGFLLLSFGYGGGPVLDLDRRVEAWVSGQMPSWAEWIGRVLTWVGGVVGVVLVVGAAVALLLRAGRRGESALLLAAALGVQVLVPVLKSIYGRSRPDAGSPIDLPSSASFPSGHAATGIAVFVTLALLVAAGARSRARLAVATALVLVGIGAGISRIVLNVHYVSDVLAGFCVGLAWLSACLLVRKLLTGGDT